MPEQLAVSLANDERDFHSVVHAEHVHFEKDDSFFLSCLPCFWWNAVINHTSKSSDSPKSRHVATCVPST